MTTRVDEVCYRDAYARQAEARVLEVASSDGPPLVVLDTTLFYPGGGGQPSDRGLILRDADGRTWTVRAARRVGGEIVHELEPPEDGELPTTGDRVRIDVEWARRYALMRTHTALHALCGVVWRDYGAQVTGGNMEPGSGRMDFEFETMSGDLVGEIEARVNAELLRRARCPGQRAPPRRGLRDPGPDPDKGQPPAAGIEQIRTIEIVGLDLQADGGTHVANTSEVGRIRVTGYESKGRINKRIRIAVVDE